MRNRSVDFLRSFGLLMVVLAHSGVTGTMFQLRNFDVPLMVFVSALCFGGVGGGGWREYLVKRFKRIVFPVWIFLTLYFFVARFCGVRYDLKVVLSAYALMNGFGYVWIFRVFLLVALFAPVLDYLCKRIASDFYFLIVLVFCFLFFEVLRSEVVSANFSFKRFLEPTLLYLSFYSVVFFVGLRSRVSGVRFKFSMAAFFFFIFVVWCVCLWVGGGRFVPTQEFKYPPGGYYVAYSVFVSCLLWSMLSVWPSLLQDGWWGEVFDYVGARSMWIFLWHIPIAEFVSVDWWLKFPLMFLAACVAVRVQEALMEWLFGVVGVDEVKRRGIRSILVC